MTFSLTDATPSDTPFIAWTVLTALAMDTKDLPRVQKMCEPDDSLYSWKHTRLATADGQPAGALVSYPGDVYDKLRKQTWQKFYDADAQNSPSFDTENSPSFEPETFPGEYYLDSLAVLPKFRHHGIATTLLRDAIAHAQSIGFHRITLIAETPKLVNFYSTIGFAPEGKMNFFGHQYTRMAFLSK